MTAILPGLLQATQERQGSVSKRDWYMYVLLLSAPCRSYFYATGSTWNSIGPDVRVHCRALAQLTFFGNRTVCVSLCTSSRTASTSPQLLTIAPSSATSNINELTFVQST